MNIQSSRHLFEQEAEIVIVGGGGCGLALAAQIDSHKIAILEKYPEYQRHHLLELEKDSFRDFPKRLQGFVDQIFQEKTSVRIPTSEIQTIFKKQLQDNVHFFYEQVDNIRSLKDRFPNAKIIIGADGSHSEVRKQIFAQNLTITQGEHDEICKQNNYSPAELEKKLQERHIKVLEGTISEEKRKIIAQLVKDKKTSLETLLYRCALEKKHFQANHQFIAELKFETPEESPPLNFLSMYKIQKAADCLVQEYVGKKKNEDKTAVTCRFFIDEKTYRKLEGRVTFKAPLTLENIKDQKQIPKKLRTIINIYLNAKQEEVFEGKIINVQNHSRLDLSKINGKLTVVNLQSYSSDVFVKNEDDVTFALVGDAAIGVPFFRSFNNGLLLTSKLAKTILHSLKKPEDHTSQFKSYNRYTNFRSYWEIFKAYLKNLFLRIWSIWIQVSARVPWQVSAFHPKFIDRLKRSPF